MTQHQTLPEPGGAFDAVAEMALRFAWEDAPAAVSDFARLLVLDLLGVGAAAGALPAARMARDHAAKHWAAGEGAASARIPFDGRRASLPGAAFAFAAQIDNLDAHDGWQPSKGHAGAALLPALVAVAEAAPALSGREALAIMIAGYELSYRAAAALHGTVEDYHTSGAWNALGAAAVGARVLGLERGALRHALGIAEYHGPRSQMMREIANPTMLHDGTMMGAAVGLQAALLAADGFLGAPAAVVEFADAQAHWADLGARWLTVEQYIKPYPICRWAHAAIDAALALWAAHGVVSAQIARVEIEGFAYASQMAAGAPETSAAAQYSLAWPVAAALAWGRVDIEAVTEARFGDPELRRLTGLTEIREHAPYTAAYPARRLGAVTLTLADGRRLESGTVEASGGPDPLPTEAEVVAKFRAYAGPSLGAARAARIEEAALGLDAPGADFKALVDLIAAPG